MGWVAGKRQRVKRKGKYVWVDPGDPVPEAEHWPNRESWERQGYIRRVNASGKPVGPVSVETRRTNALTKARSTVPRTLSKAKETPSVAAKTPGGGQGTGEEERPREGQGEAPEGEGTGTSSEAKESPSPAAKAEEAPKDQGKGQGATGGKGKATKSKKATPVKGPGECPGCGKDFLRLEQHKCKVK